MGVPSHLEILHRWHVVHIETAFVRSPHVAGWIGSWSIYLPPVWPRDVPLRYGERHAAPAISTIWRKLRLLLIGIPLNGLFAS